MVERRDVQPPGSAADAVERVLGAEREAEASLAQARQEAAAELERARSDALATVNRALERSSRWQQAHGAALAGRVESLRAQADASAGALRAPDPAAMRAAVDRIAARLTGAPEADADDVAP
jgi:colicin import membrane protein